MKSEKFWNSFAAGYDKQTLVHYRQVYSDTIVKSEQYLNADQTVLDIGCGSGIITIALAKSVKRIYATDTAEKMIEIARNKAAEAKFENIEFFVADLFDSRWENGSFDVVMAYNVLGYVKNTDAFLKKISQLMKPNGIFLSTTDCWGEKKTDAGRTQAFLSKIGLLPFMQNFCIRNVEELIRRNGFEMMESVNLFEPVPNLFIAAKKK